MYAVVTALMFTVFV